MQANIRYANYVIHPTYGESIPRKYHAWKDQCVKISREFPRKSIFLLKSRNSFKFIAVQRCPIFSCNGLMSNSYAYFPLKKKKTKHIINKAL